MEAGRCTATTKSGKPCSAQARPGRTYCLWHDPEAESERRQYAAKGGQSRSNLSRLKRSLPTEPLAFRDVQGVLGAVLRDLLAGTLDPPVANAAANVARAFAAIAQAGEMEERLRELEARAGLREPA
jgi:hypothetical protein